MEKYIAQITNEADAGPIRIPSCTLILLNEHAQLLLLKNQLNNQWQLPLTDIQTNETTTQSTLRLAKEQVCVELDDIECVGYASSGPGNVICWSDTLIHLHCFIMVSTQWHGEVKLSNEYCDLKFVGVQSLLELSSNAMQAIALFKQWLPSRVFQFG